MPKLGGLTLAKIWMAGCLLLGACCLGQAATPESPYCVDVWGAEEGLPQSAVIAITQTRDGYLWLGTLNGLVRFDGARFAVFDESNTPGLTSSRIVSLFEDSQTNLWIGTETAGVALLKNGRVTPLEIGRGHREGRLMAACEDATGAVWLYTADGYLARHWKGTVSLRSTEPSRCRVLVAESSGLVWRGSDRGLFYFDPKSAPNSTTPPEERSVPVGKLDFMLASKAGGYWRLADGLIQKWTAHHLERDWGAYPWREGTVVTAACEDWDGNLVVGTDQGLFWFDSQGKASCLSTNEGLSSKYVLSLHADQSGNLWVGTDGRGLNRVRRRLFETLKESAGSLVHSVCQGPRGGLWFSAEGGGISRLTEGALTNIPSAWGPMSQYKVRALLADPQGVWACTFGLGVFRCQGGVFQPTGQGIVNAEASALHLDRGGRLWVGTQGGLACYDGQNWRVFTTRDGLSANIVRALADDADGNLWIGTEGGGLNRLKEGQFTALQQTNGFPADNISALYVDEENVLWVGTSASGLIRLQNGEWTHYTTRDGLLSNGIVYLIEDGQGCLWIGSYRGLMRVQKKALNDFAAGKSNFVPCHFFDRRDGLPSSECSSGSQPAAGRSRDGKLWFPTTAGLAWVDPTQFGSNTNPPPVVIDSILIEGQERITNGLRARVPDSIVLPPGKERLEIQFASISLGAPGGLRFKYWMEGFEADWTDAKSSRLARYSKLPPGSYVFHVTACNEDGVWNPDDASLAVTVLPPFWRTWWFRSALSAGLLGLIIGAVYYVSTQKLQRQVAGLAPAAGAGKRPRPHRPRHPRPGRRQPHPGLALGRNGGERQGPAAEVETHARQISQTARETARALDEIVWTVNPSNDTLEGLINYICKHAQEYLAWPACVTAWKSPPNCPAPPFPPKPATTFSWPPRKRSPTSSNTPAPPRSASGCASSPGALFWKSRTTGAAPPA